MDHSIFTGILILLAAAVVISLIFRRLNLSPIIGYLIIGVCVGPYGFGLIPNEESTHGLAEFGIVFLMFTIGLEFSLPRLLSMKKHVLGLGGLQVTLTTILTMAVALFHDLSTAGALVIGGVVAMSSTAIGLKQLGEQLELNTGHGKNALGILLFQDIAVIPFLILIPSLAGGNAVFTPLLWALVKATGVMFAILIIGRWVLRPVFYEIALTRSLELFTLTILFVALGAAWLTNQMGLSPTLGAFLAGMMLGETKFRHQIEVEIRPFRDILLGLFFISVGMLLNFHVIPQLWVPILVLLLILFLFKTVLITGLSRLFGSNMETALRSGLVLAHGGEFGFALLALAMSQQLLQAENTQIVLAALIISMASAPIVIRFNGKLAEWILPKSCEHDRKESAEKIEDTAMGLSQHVVICGFGRVGQNIARIVESEGFEFIAIDMDPERVQQAQLAGDRVSYGDSTNVSILKAAGIAKAKALAIAYDDIYATRKLLPQVHEEFPELPILVRTRDDSDLQNLQTLGATEVIPETLEASLMLSFHILILMGLTAAKALRRVRTVRTERYDLLHQVFPSKDLNDLEELEQNHEQLEAIDLTTKAYAVGKKLCDLNLSEGNVTVTAVRRGGIRGPEPEPDTELLAEDVLVLYGHPDNLEKAKRLLLNGG